MEEGDIQRVHELAQRTNQMNFSGNRYTLSKIQGMNGRPEIRTLVLECQDRFGSYGTVGFAIVEFRQEMPGICDLMFSCRVQSKKVEHAFLTYFLRQLIQETGKDVEAAFRRTPRNSHSGKVFENFGFRRVGEDTGSLLIFNRMPSILDDGIVEVLGD